MPFGRPLDLEGGPQIAFFDIEANRMIKNGDRFLKKHEFTMDFRCQNERPEMVQIMLYIVLVAIQEVWVVTKFDEKLVPKWFQKLIKIKPLGAHCRVFGDFVRF